MHVLYIHQHFNTFDGSGGNRSYVFAQALVAQGHKVTVLSGSNQMAKTGLSGPFVKGQRQGVVSGIHVVEFDILYSNHNSFFSRIKKFLLFALKSTVWAIRLRYDLLYVTSTPLTVGIPALAAHFLRRKQYIFEVRDQWPEILVGMGALHNKVLIQISKGFAWGCYHFAIYCVGLSPGVCEGIEQYGKPKNQIVFIPNGCDIHFFSEALRDSDEITMKQKWAKYFNAQDFVVVFAGAHGRANGLECLIPVAEQLLRLGSHQIKFLLIGDGACKAKLMQFSQEKCLSNIVFWDPIPKTQLRYIFRRAQVGLMLLLNAPAFYYGTSPNKFFDYIAAGLPVLVNHRGWVANLISEYGCGVVVAGGGSQDFVTQLLALAQNGKQLKEKAKNSLKLAYEKFNRRDLCRDFVTLCVDSECCKKSE